jgi:hypothetical protein
LVLIYRFAVWWRAPEAKILHLQIDRGEMMVIAFAALAVDAQRKGALASGRLQVAGTLTQSFGLNGSSKLFYTAHLCSWHCQRGFRRAPVR